VQIKHKPFYKPPFNAGGESLQATKIVSYEDTVLFMISNFQYIVTCVVFSKGKPFRKPFYTNALYTISIVLLVIASAVLVLVPLPSDGFIYWDFFNMLELPSQYRLRWVAPAIVLNIVLTFAAEHFVLTVVQASADRRVIHRKMRQLD